MAAHHGEARRQDLVGQHHDGLGLVGVGGHRRRTHQVRLEAGERLLAALPALEPHVEDADLVLVLHHRADAGESDRLGEPEGVLQSKRLSSNGAGCTPKECACVPHVARLDLPRCLFAGPSTTEPASCRGPSRQSLTPSSNPSRRLDQLMNNLSGAYLYDTQARSSDFLRFRSCAEGMLARRSGVPAAGSPPQTGSGRTASKRYVRLPGQGVVPEVATAGHLHPSPDPLLDRCQLFAARVSKSRR